MSFSIFVKGRMGSLRSHLIYNWKSFIIYGDFIFCRIWDSGRILDRGVTIHFPFYNK